MATFIANACRYPGSYSSIYASSRRVGRGPLAGSYIGIVTIVEWFGAWSTPCRSTFKSDYNRVTRADAMADAVAAAKEAAAIGYVPIF